MNKKPRILLAEDNDALRELFPELLRGLGCEVTAVADGPSAIRIIEATGEQYDFLITDRKMPGDILGEEVIRCFKRVNPRGKAILITAGLILPHHRDVIFKAGADEIREKPITIENFRQMINSMIPGF